MISTSAIPAGIYVNGKYIKKKWAGLDSNQRKLTLTGLQPVPFSLSGTDPFHTYIFSMMERRIKNHKELIVNSLIQFHRKIVFSVIKADILDYFSKHVQIIRQQACFDVVAEYIA